MTREEAIKELQESHDIMRSYDIDSSESRLMTALDMAIKALEQEPCGDAISRQAALDVIAETDITNGTEPVFTGKQVQALLQDLPTVTPKQRWIPVSERLPEEDTNVLCWYEYFRYGNYNKMYQTYGVGTYFGRNVWAGDITGERARVIAWMPLPKPYEPQESEE